MVDVNGARVLVARYHRDRDESLLHLFGLMLQELHDDRLPHTAGRLALEIQVLGQLIDSYENLGRFRDAEVIKLARVSVINEHHLVAGKAA